MVKSNPDPGLDPEPSRWASETPTRGHPVFSGLLALVSVAVVVGAILGLGALLGTRVLGFGGGGSEQGATTGASMYLPEPVPTSESAASGSESGEPVPETPASSAPDEPTTEAKAITLIAAPTSVGSFERINLTGSYPTGSGAILQVQRREGGQWADFSVTVGVNGDSFATYVQTSRVGENRFRVLDSDSGSASNVVIVTVG